MINTTTHLTRTPGATALAAGVALALGLAGCASPSPGKMATGLGSFSSLYEGKSEVAYGTELPVTSAEEAIQRGDIAVAGGDLDKGLFNYIRALDLDAGNAQALYKIGAIHSLRGNERLAEIAFRWSLQKDPRNAGALTGLGILLLKKRDYPEAKQHLEQAVAINDALPSAHNALGVIADLERDYAGAQRHYQRALAGSPGSPSLLNNLGYSRYLSGNWKDASASFREALIIDPTYKLAWRNLALVYARQNRYTDAVDALAKIQDLPKAYNDVGYVAMVGGKLDDAQGFFEEAKRLSADFYTLADTNERRVAIMQGRDATP
jgi:Flp pilus assembly protein TadD